MEQRIRGHFSEALCLVVILEKLAAFVAKWQKSPSSGLVARADQLQCAAGR
jgi:hypothetical protein